MHEFADDALLGLADAHRAMGDFASAEDEYRRLLEDYPTSSLIPEAEYKLGLSFYEQSLPAALDQGMTRQAIAQFQFEVRKMLILPNEIRQPVGAPVPDDCLVPNGPVRRALLRGRVRALECLTVEDGDEVVAGPAWTF